MQSMTGYGRARACRDGREITIELKTVNHRFLDLSFRMPKNLMPGPWAVALQYILDSEEKKDET